MLYSYGITLLILCPLIFLSAFIDSIAGGGGLISLPAYIFAGLPIHTAYGTNKFTASTGTVMAVVNYLKGGCVDFQSAVFGGIFALVGSVLGTRLALSLSPRALQICLMVILPIVGIFILTRRSNKYENQKNPPGPGLKIVLCSCTGLIFGCYDGFFGPGTGMFITLVLSGLIKLDLIKSVGTAKVINFSSNITSMVTWLLNGKILFPVAIPCMICSAAGGFLGSRIAMKTGIKFIRLILVLVTVLLFAKILSDLIKI